MNKMLHDVYFKLDDVNYKRKQQKKKNNGREVGDGGGVEI
jgi:hypothetical protein